MGCGIALFGQRQALRRLPFYAVNNLVVASDRQLVNLALLGLDLAPLY